MRPEFNNSLFIKRDPELMKLWAKLVKSGAITPEDYFESLADVEGERELRGVLDGTVELSPLTDEEEKIFKARHEGPLGDLLGKSPEEK